MFLLPEQNPNFFIPKQQMDALPPDVLRHIASTYLGDKDRLCFAQVCKKLKPIAELDVRSFLPDTVLDVRGIPGFQRSRNNYAYVPGYLGLEECGESNLGLMAAQDPWTFVRVWMRLSREIKTLEFRRQCVETLSLQSVAWHADVVVALRVLLPKSVPIFSNALVKRAVWYAHLDAVAFLLDRGPMQADDENGALFRLALSTLGFEHSEAKVCGVVRELLRRGADPTRHDFWGIRLCLHMAFYDLTSLLCQHAVQWLGPADQIKLSRLVRDHVHFLSNFVFD